MPKASKKREPQTEKHSDENISFVLSIFSVCLAVFLAYSNAMTGEFLFDDRYSIVENNSIRSLLPLSHSLWGPREMPTAGRPIANLSFAMNYAHGQLNVFSYHFANITLHAINCILLFLLLRLTIRTLSSHDSASIPATSLAWMVTLLWALHPMQTETVTYVTQRTELLMALFFLLTLYAARRAWEASNQLEKYVWQILSVISCGLGMGSKEVMVVAPVMVVLYDMTLMTGTRAKSQAEHRGQTSASLHPKSDDFGYLRGRWKLYLGLFATWGILGSLLATNPRGRSVGIDLDVGPLDYLTLQFWAIVNYLWLAIWPQKLVGDYGEFKPISLAVWLPCLLILIAIVACTIWAWFRKRPWAFLGFWIFLILAPTSSIVPIATEPIAERRMYLPLAAVMCLLVAAIVGILGRWSNESNSPSKRLSSNHRNGVVCIVFLIAVIYGVATYARNEVFRTELAFWTDVTKKAPLNSRGFNVLGSTYMAAKQPELALANFKHALAIEPGESGALCNLGILFAEQGNIEEAIAYFDRAIAVNPRLFDPHFNRGLLMFRQNRLDDAIGSFKNAIQVNPNVSNVFVTLGSALFMKNEIEAAIENFRKAVEVDPRSSDAFSNLGAALNRKNEFQEAMTMSKTSLAIEPTKPAALQNLGDSLIGLGRTDEAIDAYVNCLSITPNDMQVLGKLGRAFSQAKRWENAKQCYERMLQLKPDSPEAIRELQQLGRE